MNRAARWIRTRERYHNRRAAPDDDQVAIYNGKPIGWVRLETGGPRRGAWVWSMTRDAQADMRFETSGVEETETEAKLRVVEAYKGVAQACTRSRSYPAERGGIMCGRVAQAKNPTEYGSMLKLAFTKGLPNAPAHYNGAPGQDYLVVRVHPENEDLTLDLIRWGLLPSWAKDRKMAWKMINARAETVSDGARLQEGF